MMVWAVGYFLPGLAQAAKRVGRQFPNVVVKAFSDRDIVDKRAEVEAALNGADVFFASLLFDFDQVRTQPQFILDLYLFTCTLFTVMCAVP
jgi:hypothetical protein